MAITRVQTLALATKADGSGSTVTNTLGSVPTAGNLLVACLSAGDGGGAVSISSFNDNIGDSVSWTASSLNPVTLPGGGNNQYRIYYKVVGTPSGGSKAVQCTIAGTQALALWVAEYGVSSGSPTWSVTGTPVSATGLVAAAPPNAGSITTAIADAVVVGFSGSSGALWNPGTGYTAYTGSTVWANDRPEDRLLTSTATLAVDWLTAGGDGDWTALGIAFAATTPSAPTVSTVSSNSATEGTSIVHTVTLSAATTGVSNYAASLSGGTATGGGIDYSSGLAGATYSNSVTFSAGNMVVPNGVTSWTVSVPTTDDATIESAETYTLTVGGVSGTGTINDNDAALGAASIRQQNNRRTFGIRR